MKKRLIWIAIAVLAPLSLYGQVTAGGPDWGFTFPIPAGWVHQQQGDVVVLGHNTIPGLILVMPHYASNMDEIRSIMQNGITDENMQLFPAGSLQKMADNILAGEFKGTFQYQQVKAHCVVTLAPNGGSGAFIIAMTTPQQYGQGLIKPADTIARNVRYTKTDVGDLVAHFSGRWAHYSGSTLINVTLAPNGDYLYEDESSYSGELSDGTFETGNWGAVGQNQETAKWTVRGTKESGTLIITYPDGSKEFVSYHVFVENGQTYWNEYLFDGAHYQKLPD
jgi:hypothetical protein